MKTVKWMCALCAMVGLWSAGMPMQAAELPDDPAMALEQLQKSFAEGMEGFDPSNPETAKGLAALGDQAAAYLTKFPKSENQSDVLQMVSQGYGMAAIYGKSEEAGKKLDAFVTSALQNKELPEDDRVNLYLLQKQVGLMAKAGDPTKVDQEVLMKEFSKVLLDAREVFPGNEMVYGQLMMIARQNDDKATAKLVMEDEKAPAEMRELAKQIVESKKPYELGKPLDIKFTAVDGREVDLAALKGKVVLIDFWATWCGPCVAEIPHVKEVYAKYHDKGFEIIGISFDNEKSALVDFTKEKSMPWPQFFDGKGWGNKYGQLYGINGIPTMWLVGKDGNLANLNARGNLEEKVRKLLEAQSIN